MNTLQSQKTYTVDEAKRILERFCAYRERCHKEVEEKLRSLKMIPEAQELILMHLMEHNFLNEERFAKAFARGKFSIKKWGRIKIKRELQIRAISNYNIKTAMQEIDEKDYSQTLEQIATKKAALIKENDPYKRRHKLAQFLISKGYENNLVYDVVKKF